MAESMQGLKRTHRCAELSAANAGETVTIMGWVQKNRNKGGLVFIEVSNGNAHRHPTTSGYAVSAKQGS